MTVSRHRLSVLVITAAVALAACGSSGSSAAPSAVPSGGGPAPSGSGSVIGTIAVSGSSTVEPISTGVAEAFKALNPGFNFSVEGPGTGDGFQRFCAGEIDIADASRSMSQSEQATCAGGGIDFVELKVAYDGITVMTSPNNSGVTCLSFADLYALLGPESLGFDRWSDAQALARELGSATPFPEADLAITGPGEESGTFDFFNEAVIQPIATSRNQLDRNGEGQLMRPDYTSTSNDNVIIQGITGSDTSLGYVGFAFAEENAGTIKELAIAQEPNGTCVIPAPEAISDGTYPLARPLFIYVNRAKAASNPAVAAYVDYYLAPGTIENVLRTVPYVSLPPAELAATRAAWAGR